MPLSYEEFRSSLLSDEGLRALGLPLTADEARRVQADEQASRSWYDYWLTVSGQARPPVETVAATIPLGGHDLPTSAPTAYPAAYGATTEAYATGAAPFSTPPLDPGGSGTARPRRVGLWVALSIVGALLLIAAIVTVFAFATARHWTKVDVPEKPETFHSEEYETGAYFVTDDGVSPCYVDQDWTDCIAAMEAQYAGACADVELVPSAAELCAQHRAEIDRMIAEDVDGTYVASLGDFGHLTRTPETATRQVSNDDYEPAVTHEAVCYLGFLGECE
ncbi:hypothetical protein [Microbacterium paraoxydans]|uniref:DUF732 domain-containing protein n=1 Tax=Microbacterium paraoxydans TaxID=199592 RepID=A0ABS5IQE2_9MICO|nr:hypothetical protein [Microbacterium paraoxydans]MBS0025075.1 hypothetical protein [Microbacterium paraoxydans]